ncbi:MAG: transcription antitermination factor NusB [Alteromonas sp.]|nr:transcription antitermination factor NusB [Alteromonas sp.]MAY22746.1 transcription antitermination factor NusB [Flavobacteriaceae bacterium]|tara:strand:+ start:9302 stop:10246 length:945 start_codon:yes stop_codon:yes gene_type:complete
MLTRRHIRVKVLQSLYSFYQNDEEKLDKQEKFLQYSIHQMHDLHALLLQLMVAVRDHAHNFLEKSQKKFLATEADKNPSRSFVNNQIIALIAENPILQEYISNKKLDYWKQDDEYVSVLFNELKSTDFYSEYLSKETPSFEDDKKFALQFYKEIIAPNDKLYDYLEDKRLTWLDDFPLVNTSIVKALNKISPNKQTRVFRPEVFKDEDDREFSLLLLRKVILNDDKLSKIIDGKTPNWDKERIAELDLIILKMGIAEFLYFPSIPVRVTINEYLEVAKEYSTPKSSIFINGILDKLVKQFTEEGKLNKIGRGLT